MRFIHSRGNFESCLGGSTLDSRGDFRGSIEPGQFVLPCSIGLPVLLDVLHQIAETFPFMVPCALVVPIAERPLNRVGPRTVRRQPEQRKTWMTGSPLLDGFRFMDTVVICDHIDARNLWSRICHVQQGEEFPKQPIVFPRTEAIEQLARGEMQRPSERGLLILPWRHHCGLRTLGHPRCTDLRQEVEIELIRKHHHLLCVAVFVLKPNPSQACDAVRVVLCGHQRGAVPDPADRMEPAPHGVCRDLDAVFGLERGGEGRTTPAGAAPAIGPWGFFEYGPQRAREPGHEEGRLHCDGELPLLGNPDAEAPGALCMHDAVHTGARAHQEGRNLRGVSARCTPQ
jgi:hypothetical protein